MFPQNVNENQLQMHKQIHFIFKIIEIKNCILNNEVVKYINIEYTYDLWCYDL